MTFLLPIVALFAVSAPPLAAQNWSHTDHTIPLPNSTAYGIVKGPDGNLWFGASGKMFRLSPDGTFTPFDTPEGTPFAVTVGPDGAIWYTTTNPSKRIGRITTAGVVTTFDVVSPSWAEHITGGPDGNVWFTYFCDDALFRITPAGVVTRFPVLTAGACAYGITSGPDGNLWFTEHYRNKIGRMTPDGQVTEFRIGPVNEDYPNEIVTGPDGNLWATSNYGNLRRVTPNGDIALMDNGLAAGPITAAGDYLWVRTNFGIARRSMGGTIAAFNLPDSDHGPLGLAVDADGTAWFPEIYTNAIGRIVIHPGFFTVHPCRLFDTRTFGNPLQAGGVTTVPTFQYLPLYCGVPPTARAVAANVTVADPGEDGHLTLFPTGTPLPPTSTLNYRAGRTRANNTLLPVSPDGYLDVLCGQNQGTTHAVIDITGYFQ